MKTENKRIFVFGPFLLNSSEGVLLCNGQPVTGLQDSLFDLLHIFVQKPLHIFSRDELMKALWRDDYINKNDNTLTKYISDLRDVLRRCDQDMHRCVETRRRKGYRFACNVTKYDVEGVSDEIESLYIKAVFNLQKYSKEGFEKATGFFRHSIDLNENYAPAWAGLAEAYIWYTVFCYNTLPAKEMLEKARACVDRALAIDPSLAAVHAVNGFVKIFYDWDWEEAEKEFTRAIEIDQNHAPAHLGLSLLFSAKGDEDQAFREIDLALHYDKFSRLLNIAKGIVCFEAGRFSEALGQFRETEEDTREFVVAAFDGAYFGEALIYTQEGLFDEAFVAAKRAYEFSGNILNKIAMCYISTVAQKKVEAQTLLDELMVQADRRYVSPFHLATIFLARGDKVRTRELLERACEECDPWILFLKTDPRFDALHSDDCFSELLERIKFPPSRDA